MQRQSTIKHSISCLGIGIHSGKSTSLSLYPAPVDSGVIFIRNDIHDKNNEIKATYDSVSRTRLGTTICNADNVEISTIEHLMAALWGCGIDNVICEVDGEEIPIMDGSAEQFIFMIECAGVETQSKQRRSIEVLKELTIKDGDSYIKISPSDYFSVATEINFDDSKLISTQKFEFSEKKKSFKHDLSRARTFGFKEDADLLRKHGFAQGASLDNVIVISGDKILNKSGFRYPDECVRHKTLDLIGDFYLASATMKAHIETFKPSHTINNKALRELFADQSAWKLGEL